MAHKHFGCGRRECGVSTFIDDVTLTFGSGELDGSTGLWEHGCATCARAWKKDHPDAEVWPDESDVEPAAP